MDLMLCPPAFMLAMPEGAAELRKRDMIKTLTNWLQFKAPCRQEISSGKPTTPQEKEGELYETFKLLRTDGSLGGWAFPAGLASIAKAGRSMRRIQEGP